MARGRIGAVSLTAGRRMDAQLARPGLEDRPRRRRVAFLDRGTTENVPQERSGRFRVVGVDEGMNCRDHASTSFPSRSASHRSFATSWNACPPSCRLNAYSLISFGLPPYALNAANTVDGGQMSSISATEKRAGALARFARRATSM